MSTYVVVPKRDIPDDILDGLINDNKIYDGPLANFYTFCKKTITQLIATNTIAKEELTNAVDAKNYKQLRSILIKLNDAEIDNLFSFSNTVVELEQQEEKIKSDIPNINLINSYGSTVTFSLDNLKLSHKDIKKSDFWEINFEKPSITVCTATQGGRIYVNKIICNNFSHPYASSDKLVRLAGAELTLGENFVYDAISYSINYLKMFREEKLSTPLENFIGKKCSITGVYTYGKGITCPRTKDHLLLSEAKIINGRHYSPKIVKECDKCKKESINWISTNKVITCGECNDSVS